MAASRGSRQGKASRRKGAVGEREVASLLRRVFPDARRRSSGEESQTEQGRDLSGMPGFCAQVCRARRPPIERKLREAAAARKAGEMAVAFTRSDGGHWIASMSLFDWMQAVDLYRQQRGGPRDPVSKPGAADRSGEDEAR